MNSVKIEYNTEKPAVRYPEYGRAIQEMVEHAKTLEPRQLRQKTAESIIGLMIMVSPNNPNRNMDDFREKLWNHLFAIANYELDVDAPAGINIVKPEEKPGQNHSDTPIRPRECATTAIAFMHSSRRQLKCPKVPNGKVSSK